MLRVCPDDDWLSEFFSLSLPLLASASGPQLANTGWALAQLRCQPPRQWLNEWGQQMRIRSTTSRRPMGIKPAMWHGIGYSKHAERAAVALSAFGVRDLVGDIAMHFELMSINKLVMHFNAGGLVRTIAHPRPHPSPGCWPHAPRVL